jgi:Cu+-exporting ATPase
MKSADRKKAAESENAELKDMSGRFWASAPLTLPLILLAMAHMLAGEALNHLLPGQAAIWLKLLLRQRAQAE